MTARCKIWGTSTCARSTRLHCSYVVSRLRAVPDALYCGSLSPCFAVVKVVVKAAFVPIANSQQSGYPERTGSKGCRRTRTKGSCVSMSYSELPDHRHPGLVNSHLQLSPLVEPVRISTGGISSGAISPCSVCSPEVEPIYCSWHSPTLP